MENKLRMLFDYQKFENEPRLKNMLEASLKKYDFSSEGELSDDEAGLLSAAGSLVTEQRHGKELRS